MMRCRSGSRSVYRTDSESGIGTTKSKASFTEQKPHENKQQASAGPRLRPAEVSEEGKGRGEARTRRPTRPDGVEASGRQHSKRPLRTEEIEMMSKHVPPKSARPRHRGVSAGFSTKPTFQGRLDFYPIQIVLESGQLTGFLNRVRIIQRKTARPVSHVNAEDVA